MSNLRLLATALLVTTVVSCKIDPLPPRSNHDAASSEVGETTPSRLDAPGSLGPDLAADVSMDSRLGLETGADARICIRSGSACILSNCSATATTYSCSSAIVRAQTDYTYSPSGSVTGWTNCSVESNGNMVACTVYGDDSASSGYCIGSGGASCAWGDAIVSTCDDPTTQTPSCGGRGTDAGISRPDSATNSDVADVAASYPDAKDSFISKVVPDAQVGDGTRTDSGGPSTDTLVASGGLSCLGLAKTCGPSGNESCCTSLLVPGGTFTADYDGAQNVGLGYSAEVADFYLDKYEITVGRFRAFVTAGMDTQATPPAQGGGAHPLIPGSGWNSTWNTPNLFPDTNSLKAALNCDPAAQTWTDEPAGNEDLPMNCLDWYDAFAFCAWDGGRLPTKTEWDFAAAGGSEQRVYPWSIPPTYMKIDDSYAVYCGGSCGSAQSVGSKSPKGDGKWGHADLAGNVWEWALDCSPNNIGAACVNCAYITCSVGSNRTIRGGSFKEDDSLLESAIDNYEGGASERDAGQGARCARNTP